MPTRLCERTVNGQEVGLASVLAICQYDEDADFILYYCDADCRILTHTHHDSLEAAQEQAEYEYEGVSAAWIYVK